MENRAITAGQEQLSFRYYDLVMVAFVTILLLSNLIGASKPSYITLPVVGQWSFGAGVLFFPVSYIIGDVLTEVYGYARARRVIWTGFAALLFMAFMAWVVVSLPAAEGWPGQEAYEFVFGNSWRIVLASMVAFWAGEFANSFVLAKMKVWTAGRHLWMRTIGSTIVGQGLDSLIFYPLAFWGLAGWPVDLLWQVILSQWLIKTLWEALLTPVTYLVVGKLKRAERVEIFDEHTNFSPFASR
ncbi:queuosine precursor transporter [Qipengyuania sp. NPDC077563]|uniref:queuosine precursor transporter n=1 Tax=Qipengyuania sp. NPDC077563 TaxID=3364497 RepID=UPI00384A71C7